MEAMIDLLQRPGGRLQHLWSLREDVVVKSEPHTGFLVLTWDRGSVRMGNVDATVQEALRRMQLGPVLLGNALAGDEDLDPDATVHLLAQPVFRRLPHLIVRALGLDDLNGPLLSIAPLAEGEGYPPVVAPLDRGIPLQLVFGLSFAFDGVSATFEAQSASHRLVIHRHEAMMVVAMLVRPTPPTSVMTVLPLPAEVTEGILRYLVAAGVAAVVPL